MFNLQLIVEHAASPEEAASWGTAEVAGNSQAEFLLKRWEDRVRKLHPDATLFQKRLDKLNLTRTTALDWLRPRQYPTDRSLPSWAILLEEVLSPENFVGEPIEQKALLGPIRGLDGPDEPLPRKRPVFLELARPFLHVAIKQLRAVGEFNRWLEPAAVEDVLRILLHRLSGMAARTLAYEVKQRSKAGELRGETPVERYTDFMSRHVGTPDGLWQLFQQYPVLARLLAVRTEQTIGQVVEIVKRMDADAGELDFKFKISDFRLKQRTSPGAAGSGRLCESEIRDLKSEIPSVVQVQLGLSDPHLGGRSVAILKFTSGHKLVYKPRSLALDEAYSSLLARWNQLPGVPTLKSAAVLSRVDYGWAEHIAAADCQSTEEVAEYYRRQGTQTAIFYMLRGTDFHSENFIAHGAWPVPIDLECLFTATYGQAPLLSQKVPPCFRMWNTLFPTCMPPHWKSGEPGELCSLDGGIGGNAGRTKTQTVAVWSGLETDRLSMAMESRQEKEVSHSLPRLAGQPIGPEAFMQPLLEGFRQAYDALRAHRQELLAPGGLLEAFQHLSTRCLMRATVEYTFLLSWATAPDQLTSGAAHDLAFEILVKYGTGLGNTLDWMDDEKRSLWNRDVPFYVANASFKRLTSAAGEEIGPELVSSSYEQVTALLNAACEEDRDWQSEMIRGCLQMSFEPEHPRPPERSKTADPLLVEAIRLGEILARQAIRDSRGVTWLTIEKESHDPTAVMLGPVRPGLYSGGEGIAVFLANLAAAADEPEFAELARRALRFAGAQVDFIISEWSGYRDRQAAFGSPFSQAYALAECGRILSSDALIDQALNCALLQNECPPVDNPDFINGAAGAICVLLHVYSIKKDDRLLSRALHLAEAIQRDFRSADGKAWRLPGAERPILGLGHGQVGIALAFEQLARFVDLPWANQAVQQALEYENELFDNSLNDWPNRWYGDGEGHPMVGWCGGAPGHGLARLGLLGGPADGPSADNELLRRGIEQALAAVQRRVQPLPQNLCCGEPGCIWFLAEAGRLLDRPELIEQARTDALALVQYRRDHGRWHMRPVSEREVLPTLMGGIAGIGLSLLEARQPGSVSQVVLLH